MSYLSKMIDFLNKLEKYNIDYKIEKNTSDSIMVIVRVPYKFYEIEFFSNGKIDIEELVSKGVLASDNKFLDEIIEKYKD